jgi:hypothetical protein
MKIGAIDQELRSCLREDDMQAMPPKIGYRETKTSLQVTVWMRGATNSPAGISAALTVNAHKESRTRRRGQLK